MPMPAGLPAVTPVASPCTLVCTIDDGTGLCIGCARTLGEIARWSVIDDYERRAILAALPNRRPTMPHTEDVRDNTAKHRFELSVDGETAIAAYRRDGDAIVFTHTEVPSALEGKGVGSKLVAGALAQARAASLKIDPQCSFVAAYMKRHPDV